MDSSNTHFCKIVCKDLQIGKCYVGPTTNFTKRKNTHKNNCNNMSNKNSNAYLYQFMRENGGFNNFEMVLLETLDCNSRLEALRKERQYIEELNATLTTGLVSRVLGLIQGRFRIIFRRTMWLFL